MDHATCVSFQVGRKKNSISKNDDVFKNYYSLPPLHKETNPPASLYWETYTTPEGEQYFYNIITGQASWEGFVFLTIILIVKIHLFEGSLLLGKRFTILPVLFITTTHSLEKVSFSFCVKR